MAKVALVNPADLAMLEESHDLLQALGGVEPLPVGEAVLNALHAEDRPKPPRRVENAKQIAAILEV